MFKVIVNIKYYNYLYLQPLVKYNSFVLLIEWVNLGDVIVEENVTFC